MEKAPMSDGNPDETTIFIKVPKDECNELFTFLNSSGIKARKSLGVTDPVSSQMDRQKLDKELAKGTPYLMVRGVAKLIASGLNAYAKWKTGRKILVEKAAEGVEFIAEDFTVEEIKKLRPTDLLVIEPLNNQSNQPKTKEQKDKK
jgi:hypothetical protein